MIQRLRLTRLVGNRCFRCTRSFGTTKVFFNQKSSQQQEYLDEYKIRTLLERPIDHYARKQFPPVNLKALFKQSEELSEEFIMQNAKESVERLLAFTARGLKEFRKLPYLVVLNPSISEGYETYLQSMTLLLNSTLKFPKTREENKLFTEEIINGFIDLHSDTLPSLSKGFNEVLPLLSEEKVKAWLDNHLTERISMRLIAHQHVSLTNTLNSDKFVPGGKYNGTVQPLDIISVIKKNAELINDIFFLKYDQTIPIQIETDGPVTFPYIEYHLDYILSELFKNSFRSQVESDVLDPVVITIVHSENDLQIRIRDKGKGIPDKVLAHIFDYSFTTFDSGEGEGDSYKTLNVPPGEGGNVVAGMGYGLPLLKNYIETFNEGHNIAGSLSLQTYPECGTDIYLKIKIKE